MNKWMDGKESMKGHKKERGRKKYKGTKEWKKENTKELLNEKYEEKSIVKGRKVGRKEINCLESYGADLSSHQRALVKHSG